MNMRPENQGLYDSANEHDACGIGFIANIHGQPSHEIIQRGLQLLERMAHRGAEGADKETGDGAGILMQNSAPFLFANHPQFTGKWAIWRWLNILSK